MIFLHHTFTTFIKLFFLLWIVWYILNPQNVSGEDTCEHRDKINRCYQANVAWTHRWIPESDFMCPGFWKDYDAIAYNIILDQELQKVDEIADKYLSGIDENPEYFFWENKKASFMSWLDEIDTYFTKRANSPFYLSYKQLCWISTSDTVIRKVLACSLTSSTSYRDAEAYWVFWCKSLITKKIDARYRTAEILMWKNQDIVNRLEKKDFFDTVEKEAQPGFFDAIRNNIWYLQKITQKWTSKTKDNVH